MSSLHVNGCLEAYAEAIRLATDPVEVQRLIGLRARALAPKPTVPLTASPVLRWPTAEVVQWLKGIAPVYSAYAAAFEAAAVDGPTLLVLNGSALIAAGVDNALRRARLLSGIAVLRMGLSETGRAALPVPPCAPMPYAPGRCEHERDCSTLHGGACLIGVCRCCRCCAGGERSGRLLRALRWHRPRRCLLTMTLICSSGLSRAGSLLTSKSVAVLPHSSRSKLVDGVARAFSHQSPRSVLSASLLCAQISQPWTRKVLHRRRLLALCCRYQSGVR
jgi:hypothetical protein